MAQRRANGEGSIRKHKDRRWEDCYSTGYDSEPGKQIFKNVVGKTQGELKEKLNKAISIDDTRAIDVRHPEGYTVASWVLTWFELYSKPNIRPFTAEYYQNFIRDHIVPKIGARSASWPHGDIQEALQRP